MQLDCRGAGAPLVVFESGLDINGPLSWTRVHDDVAKVTRACTYSRAGLMWSDPRAVPVSAKAIADDLHATLENAGERGPLVLVGHSLGGPYVLTFTYRYDVEVAGMVLVEATHPDQIARLAAVHFTRPTPSRTQRMAVALAWTGIIRLMSPGRMAPENEPPEAVRAMAAHAPATVRALLEESDAYPETLREAGAFRSFGDRPLYVLTAMPPVTEEDTMTLKMTREEIERIHDARRTLHDEEAAWSSHSRHEIVTDSDHVVQLDRPDVVIKAVEWVVEAVRARG